jgi:membrane glycosyltransferase
MSCGLHQATELPLGLERTNPAKNKYDDGHNETRRRLSILDLAVLILVASLFFMRYLMNVDPRFPVLVSIVFLLASGVFYSWDPLPWATLAFFSFMTGLLFIVIDRLRSKSVNGEDQDELRRPFFGRLDKVIRSRKEKKGTEP